MAISKIITSSLTDDAVTSAKIGTDQVGADALSSSAISGAVDIPANSVGESELSIDLSAQSVPHIIPGVLQPAVAGKDLSGTALGGSYVYGTAHTDGHKYYYTDIKGSKPIKDPRIGAHFGSQRHKFKSLQLLEQETATEGVDVYSVDGREWMRARGDVWTAPYNANGNFLEPSNRLKDTDSQFIEIVGFFNDANILHWSSSATHDQFGVAVNGGTRQNNDLAVGIASPLSSRYVDSGSASNLTFNATPTLGINTLRISNTTGAYFSVFGIELIAQDTASSARRSEIKIPKQNVVSFGKKFEVGSDDLDNAIHPHYDPFNGFTSGNLAAVQALGIDTDSSLGLSKWLLSGTYYRPFNGARVVKYVDSTGTIKTAVTVMPPNAKSIANSASPTNAFATRTTASHYATNNAMNSFEVNGDGIDSDQLSEVAKTFWFREFGNGAANEGTGGANYADASMLSSADDIAYVMDDGLTSLSGDSVSVTGSKDLIGDNDDGTSPYYVTFIGTGMSVTNTADTPRNVTWFQNLPYGTHVVKVDREGGTAPDVDIDGVEINDNSSVNYYGEMNEVTFYQPKKPPIPEDCVVLADYMLMADYVPRTSNGIGKISKGVRLSDCSRDVLFDSTHASTLSGFGLRVGYSGPGGFGFSSYNGSASATHTAKQEFYGDGIVFNYWESSSTYRQQTFKLYIDDTLLTASNFSGVTVTSPYFTYNSSNGTFTQVSYVSGQYYVSIKGLTLGHHTLKYSHDSTADTHQGKLSGFDVSTPIHTSSHYQSFETPFLHELVGGDRNMEQTNLVVSPDGKSWDQLTRDTSYIGNCVFSATRDGGNISNASWVYDWYRGNFDDDNNTAVQKEHWAIAYDRLICLVDGTYEIYLQNYFSSADGHLLLNKNATGNTNANAISYRRVDPGDHTGNINVSDHFMRGDYINLYVAGNVIAGEQTYFTNIQIKKL